MSSDNQALIAELRDVRHKPPIYLALDLWMAQGLDSNEFDGYYERNGWADTWANLLGAVRERFVGQTCGWVTDEGEPCVINIVGHVGPHMGASDVGSSEPLPVGEEQGHE